MFLFVNMLVCKKVEDVVLEDKFFALLSHTYNYKPKSSVSKKRKQKLLKDNQFYNSHLYFAVNQDIFEEDIREYETLKNKTVVFNALNTLIEALDIIKSKLFGIQNKDIDKFSY